MTAAQHEVSIEVTCTQPPLAALAERGEVFLGIQQGKSVEEIQPVDAKRIVFRPLFQVHKHNDGTPVFGGPCAHGPRPERFIYLVWIEQGPPARMFGRIKLHLNHIEWAAVEKAAARAKPIKVTVPLTNAKGKVVVASVRPDAAQWSL